MTYGGPALRANGYYFITAEGPPETDPVRWIVEVLVNSSGPAGDPAADSANGWAAVGASGWNRARRLLLPQVQQRKHSCRIGSFHYAHVRVNPSAHP